MNKALFVALAFSLLAAALAAEGKHPLTVFSFKLKQCLIWFIEKISHIVYFNKLDCWVGRNYSGTVDETIHGEKCIPWKDVLLDTGITGNYCRNPDDRVTGPWCYYLADFSYMVEGIQYDEKIEDQGSCSVKPCQGNGLK